MSPNRMLRLDDETDRILRAWAYLHDEKPTEMLREAVKAGLKALAKEDTHVAGVLRAQRRYQRARHSDYPLFLIGEEASDAQP